jgi:peptide/nickel transport system ATP-binding protein
MDTPILEVQDLRVEFKSRRGVANVLDGVSFSLAPGETLGIVGESGCGKSMTALAIMGLIPNPPGRITGGRICFREEELTRVSDTRMRTIRGKDISMIFQEPMTSLNPVFTIGNQITEALTLHLGLTGKLARRRAIDMLTTVGIPAPEKRIDEYPHQLSGGMRQRAMIAMALACEPAILIADEPTTALDVTVQAQIFDLLRELQTRTGTAIILITHDMGVVAQMADRAMVMYAGRSVEKGGVSEVLGHALHPYTRGLIECLPAICETDRRPTYLPEIRGMVPSIWELGRGCVFANRCSEAFERCRCEAPPPYTPAAQREVACWLYEEKVRP